MQEHDNSVIVTPKRIPWNKGKLVGQKAPLRLKRSGQFAFACSSPRGLGSSLCSI